MNTLNAVIEVLKEYPTENEIDFKDQFADWSKINQYGNIDPVDLRLIEEGRGGDRVIYKTKHPDILLKAAFGPQEVIIPDDFDFLYLPFFEFQFPTPLQDPDFQDGRTWGQFQLRISPHRPWGQQYAPTRALQSKIQAIGGDIGFSLALIKHYSLDVLEEWLMAFKQYSGMRAPSSQNWGWLNQKPIIFDCGRIIE
jgi:hypothetical protein